MKSHTDFLIYCLTFYDKNISYHFSRVYSYALQNLFWKSVVFSYCDMSQYVDISTYFLPWLILPLTEKSMRVFSYELYFIENFTFQKMNDNKQMWSKIGPKLKTFFGLFVSKKNVRHTILSFKTIFLCTIIILNILFYYFWPLHYVKISMLLNYPFRIFWRFFFI